VKIAACNQIWAEFQRVGVALNTGRRLDHLNPQTQEFSFNLDPAAQAPAD
jgi:hypothetical protein